MIDKDEFTIVSNEDEIRVDGLSRDLLREFYEQLLRDGLPPEHATELANSADYFVRDFMVSITRQNLFEERPGAVRRFAGNWYIVNTLEPNMPELGAHLEGIRSFYTFLETCGLIGHDFLTCVQEECDDTEFYGGRIESFWNITGDGYLSWERECSLKE